MSGIAGIVHWDQRPASGRALQAMLELIEHRGPDGLTSSLAGSVALGAARLALNKRDRPSRQPTWSPDHHFATVADARLYNRKELIAELSATAWLGAAPTDEELILAGYETWGAALCDHLSGDFAFAVWDTAERRLFAARDPFGVKPFFYRFSATTFAFGSEVKQLLVGLREPVQPDTLAITELLLAQPQAGRETAIQGIYRLEAGHQLVATETDTKAVPYWPPPNRLDPDPVTVEDFPERFGHLFRDAVERRIGSTYPVAIELSGGLDSSAIAATAGQLCSSGKVAPAEVSLLSHIYPGLSCDEQEHIRSVAHTLPFALITISCSTLVPAANLPDQHWLEGAPDADLALARTRLAGDSLSRAATRVLLTGLGGDELTWEPEWAPDLLRSGKLTEAARQIHGSASLSTDRTHLTVLGQTARLALNPRTRHYLRFLVNVPRSRTPAWIDANLFPVIARLNRAKSEPRNISFASRAQEQVFSWITAPFVRWGLERAELRMANQGVELRHPYFDRDLVEHVLSVPWRARIQNPGPVKPLLSQSVGMLLPQDIRSRTDHTVFNDYFERLMVGWLRNLRRPLRDSRAWASSGYTRRAAVQDLVDSWRPAMAKPWRPALQIWAAVNLEFWLREIDDWTAAAARARNDEREASTS